MEFRWIEKRLDELPFVNLHFWMSLQIMLASLTRNYNIVRFTIQP